jgi:hypothetical protein
VRVFHSSGSYKNVIHDINILKKILPEAPDVPDRNERIGKI